MEFVKINKDNLELACEIQNSIFPKENARVDYLEQIDNSDYWKELEFSIVYIDEKPIGITGLYSYNQYPEIAWLGWFGVLEEYRCKGYGREIVNKMILLAKEKGYKEFRMYVDEYATSAHRLYSSIASIKEIYDREDDKDEYLNEEIFIYSLSLTDEEISLWDNKMLYIKEQGEKRRSI